jgi:hypothetical protein
MTTGELSHRMDMMQQMMQMMSRSQAAPQR